MEAERNRGVDSEQMMVAEIATAPEPTGRHSEQQHQANRNTTCAYCPEGVDVYQLGAAWVCTDHLAASVSLACDVWPADVSYSKAFETVLM